MRSAMKTFMMLVLSLFSTALYALEGISFTHKDWELACDNTGTCRAAGYQTEDNYKHPISLLFTRAAGKNTSISGQLQIYADTTAKNTLADLFINEQKIASFDFSQDIQIVQLNAQQTQQLFTALKKSPTITLKYGTQTYQLSNAGFNAVWLKMNEFQGRLAGQQLLQPLPKPQIQAVKTPAQSTEINVTDPSYQLLLEKLKQANRSQGESEACYDLLDNIDSEDANPIYINELNEQQSLVSTICIRGAYNFPSFFVIMDHHLNEIQQIIGSHFTDYVYGYMLDGTFKGRGVGDCFFVYRSVWNGKEFIKSDEFGDEQCKGFGGGAWQLPTYVSEVIEPK